MFVSDRKSILIHPLQKFQVVVFSWGQSVICSSLNSQRPRGLTAFCEQAAKNYFVGFMLTQHAANHSQVNYFVTSPPQKIESSEWDSVSLKPTS